MSDETIATIVESTEDDENLEEFRHNFNVVIIKPEVSSITINWDLVENTQVYRVEKFHKTNGWLKVGW